MSVISVAYFVEDKAIRNDLLKWDAVRAETLKICLAMEGYRELPRNEKTKIYDEVRNKVLKKYF